MNDKGWSHNIHYHDLVLSSIPANRRRICDVGCGRGLLAGRLARHCDELVAIDSDSDTLAHAKNAWATESRITFVEGDVMTYPFAAESFDVVTAVATLHHLPLAPALRRFRDLLKPGGVLVIIGLYRARTLTDYALAVAALPPSRILRLIHGAAPVGAPLAYPNETLREIRTACEAELAGAAVRRLLFYRYSLIWNKP